MANIRPIPTGFHTLTPTLTVDNAAEAIEFYKRAFGAQEVERCLGPSNKVMHAEIRIGDSTLMLNDEFPDWDCRSPKTIGGTASAIYVYVEHVDKVFDRAVKAGATVVMPLQDQFWGDRCGQIIDPYGHKWSIATHVEDVSPEEMQRRQEEWLKQPAGAGKKQSG